MSFGKPGSWGCRGEWTEEEDQQLRKSYEAVQQDLAAAQASSEPPISRRKKQRDVFSWGLVAKKLGGRTDNQCLRRWKALHPGGGR